MPHEPTACFTVLAPMIGPLPARVGEYVCLRRDRPDANVWVVDATRQHVRAKAMVAPGVLYGMVLALCNAEVIRGLSASDYRTVSRLTASRQVEKAAT